MYINVQSKKKTAAEDIVTDAECSYIYNLGNTTFGFYKRLT